MKKEVFVIFISKIGTWYCSEEVSVPISKPLSNAFLICRVDTNHNKIKNITLKMLSSKNLMFALIHFLRGVGYCWFLTLLLLVLYMGRWNG